MRACVLLAVAGVLSGCAAGPASNGVSPPPTLAQWTEAAGARAGVSDIADDWWTPLADDALARVVTAAGNTPDVRIATARLAEAEALLRTARANLRPDFVVGVNAVAAKNGDGPPRQDSADVQAGANWEIDLFGANRSRAARALSEREAAMLRISAARISARTTAALLYFTQAESARKLETAQRTIASLTDSLSMARSRENAGLGSALDVAQALAALAAAKAAAPRYEAARTAAARGLESVLGLTPGALTAELAELAPGALPRHVQTLFPADVLARRPDVAASERFLVAAGFDVTAARADFYPKLRIGAGVGAQTLSAATPYQDSGLIASLIGGLTMPIFDRSRLNGSLDAAAARQRIAAETHRQVIIDALAQVETAANAYEQAQSAAVFAQSAVGASEQQLTLARSRYQAGINSFIDVVAAEQAVLNARQSLISTQADAARALAELYGAMGLGGA
jgi:NodT family efflux transporter outer membrane factor (OMF) lipoprotein